LLKWPKRRGCVLSAQEAEYLVRNISLVTKHPD